MTAGATAASPVTSREMASASASSNCGAAVNGPRRAPGVTNSRLRPIEAMEEVTLCVAPEPSETMAITAPTPMTMPSVVRPARSRLFWILAQREEERIQDHGLRFPGVRRDQPSWKRTLAAGVSRHVFLMRHQHDGQPLFGVERLQQAHDLMALGAVEIAGRLVGEHDGGRGDKRTRDGDALLLAARQFDRGVVGAVGEANLCQCLHAAAGKRSALGTWR